MPISKGSTLMSSIVQTRTHKRRWVYGACAVLVALVGLWSTEEGLRYAIPYAAMLALFIVQFIRPTLLGWFIGMSLFAAYAIATLVKASFPSEYLAALLIGFLPTLVLIWARPRRESASDAS